MKNKTKKKLNRNIIILILGIGILAVVVSLPVITGNNGKEEKHPVPENTPGVTITEAVTPTAAPTEKPENTPVPTATTAPTKQELVEEQVKDTEYVIEAGEDIVYVFQTDGTLKISGTGETISFETESGVQDYFLTQVYMQTTGEEPETPEEVYWCQPVLDRVTEIVVEEGVTGIGDSACRIFDYAETVTLPSTLEKVGVLSFAGTGRSTEAQQPEITGLNEETTECDSTSFLIIDDAFLENAREEAVKEQKKARPRDEAEWGTLPHASLAMTTIRLGETADGTLYKNGVLVINGTGALYDFDSIFDAREHIREALNVTTRAEVAEEWYDRVAEIYIAGDITRIGNFALSDYKRASVVTADKEIKEYGRYAFLYCGTQGVTEPVWNLTFAEDTVIHETAFHQCKNVGLPTEEETVLEEEKLPVTEE